MNLIIFDINKEFIQEAKRLEKYGIKVVEMDVNNLINSYQIDTLVSPANSFGYMNGGIDKVYSDIFSGIQQTVQNKIKEVGVMSNMGKYAIPVGSAITVQTNYSKCPYLISAPTMYLPGNIRGTNNVFFCFIAVLYLLKNGNGKSVACPGLGTSIGGLSPKDAVDQMENAIKLYDDMMKNGQYLSNIKYYDKFNLVMKN